MNNIETNRSSFFPNSKKAGAQKNKAAALQKAKLARNDSARKNHLDAYTKNDAKVDISDGVKDFAKIKKAVQTAPEIDNSDKVARLKQQIQSGQYKVDHDALADKILSSEF